MNDKRNSFSAAKYRQIAQNPFVDRKMLQFVRERTLTKPGERIEAGTPPKTARTGGPGISDAAAKLIAAAISGLLRE